MDEILRLKDLSFRYEEEKEWALKEVSLSISSGEKIAVLGNNGAGKSTFFRCCNGILRPKEGSLYLKGEKISWKKKEILNLRQSVGLIFQEADHQLIAGTVAEEVSFGPMNLKLSEQEVRNRVEKALAAMDLLKYQEMCIRDRDGDIDSYSEETRTYQKILGETNQKIGEMADQITEVVYGIPVPVKV